MFNQRNRARQSIMPSRAWRSCASVALLLLLGVSSGCNQIFGLDETTLAPTGPGNAYTCECTCNGGGQNIIVKSSVCLPADLNPLLDPTLPPDFEPSPNDVKQDCENRVQRNVQQLARQCVARQLSCNCDASIVATFGAECNEPCIGEVLADDCSNFNPQTGDKTATNVPGEDPVCFIASSDPPDPVPDPLAAGIFGRSSTCEVTGEVTIMQGDDSQSRSANGVVEFSGDPCPGESCEVGMSYRLDHVNTFEFDGYAGFATTKFENLRASGATLPQGAMLDASGLGTFPSQATLSSGQGKRRNFFDSQIPGAPQIETSSARAAYIGTNSQPIDVLVDWTNHECVINGALLGSLEDEDTSVEVMLAGDIVNEPPSADAGADATVECTSSAGAGITLDGTGSTDPENNIALAVWRQETRVGEEVGSALMVNLNQELGVIQPYFLKVVDTFGQASEDLTLVSVVDTTPPTIGEATATPNVLWPPNHKMVGVMVDVSSSDLCSTAACQISAVSSNEPVNSQGDGNTTPDWQITGALTVNLRAERSGKGSGRVYTIAVECSDASGNSSTKTTTVAVSHNQG